MIYEISLILGAIMLATGVGAYLHPAAFHRMFGNFAENPATTYLSGLLAIAIGVLIVISHNVWVADWPIIITLIGWGSLIKGAWLIVSPKSYMTAMKSAWKTSHVRGEGVFMIILGGMLIYLSVN